MVDRIGRVFNLVRKGHDPHAELPKPVESSVSRRQRTFSGRLREISVAAWMSAMPVPRRADDRLHDFDKKVGIAKHA